MVLSALILWSAFTSWQEAERLRARLNSNQLESFKIADHLQSSILQLNTILIRSELRSDGEETANFRKGSQELNEWIDRKNPELSSDAERRLLKKIDAAYDVYLDAATNAFAAPGPASDSRRGLLSLEQTMKASAALLDLGYQLEDAHRKLLEDFFAASQKSVGFLQWLTFGALLLLLLFVFGAFAIGNRERITRLRLELVQSKTIIERQEKLAALGSLAAGVAHEIRTPLTAIKARLFTLQNKLMPGAGAYEDSELIRNEIHRLESLVKEVLQFARPAEPRLMAVFAGQPLREVHQLMAPQLERAGSKLVLKEVDTATILADAQQLKQVLINLIQNASESLSKNGRVVLRCLRQKRTVKGVPVWAAVFQVEDNGAGITPEIQARLFDPFFTTKSEGTGLGLAIASRIVEMHSGSLEYKTVPGSGTLFEAAIPLAPEENAP